MTARIASERRLRSYRQKLQSLAAMLSLTEERERRRIASELHDRTVQSLGLCKINLGALRDSLHHPKERLAVEDIRNLINQVIIRGPAACSPS